jgi:hypothetical protein
VSGAVIAEIVPVLLLAPIAGVIVDWLPRVRVMVAADLWRTALAGCCTPVDHVTAATATAQRDTRHFRRAWSLFHLMARGAFLAAPARSL